MFSLSLFPKKIQHSSILSSLYNKNILSPIDFFFAAVHLYSSSFENEKEEVIFLFLALVSSIVREGHLGFIIEDNYLLPFPKESFPYALEGFLSLPKKLFSSLFIVENSFCFLANLYQLKESIFKEFFRLKNNSSFIIPILKEDSFLTKEQFLVANSVLKKKISFLTGGPGTGKTFLCSKIIKHLLVNNIRVVVLAFTGKAISNLKASCKKINVNIQASTIDHFLILNKHKIFFDEDFFIFDESSMISMSHFFSFFSKIKSKSRILMVGDTNQLPPIGLGSYFAYLTQKNPSETFYLTKTLRTDIKNIKILSETILKGLHIPHFPLPTYKNGIEEIANLFYLNYQQNLSFCVITPLKYGFWGRDALNKNIFLFLQKKSLLFPIPIVITKNFPTLDLWNGDTGYFYKEKDLIIIDNKTLSTKNFSNFSFNYATTVHKSQGSEYDHVLVIISEYKDTFSREILYTSVTRAKKSVIIWGDSESLSSILKNTSQKLIENTK